MRSLQESRQDVQRVLNKIERNILLGIASRIHNQVPTPPGRAKEPKNDVIVSGFIRGHTLGAAQVTNGRGRFTQADSKTISVSGRKSLQATCNNA